MINKPSNDELNHKGQHGGSPFVGIFCQEAKVLGYKTSGLSSRRSNICTQKGQKSLRGENSVHLFTHSTNRSP